MTGLTKRAPKQKTETEGDFGEENGHCSKRKFRAFKSLYSPRPSPLDFETLITEKHPFRGFFVLFWVSCGYKISITMYQHYRQFGVVVSTSLVEIMGKDIYSFGRAEGLMVLSLFAIVLFQWFINWRIVPLRTATFIQHTWQFIWFVGILGWVFIQDWEWSAIAVLTMHTIAMLMKQHSYTAYNISLHYKLRRLKDLKKQDRDDDGDLHDEEIAEMDDLQDELSRGGAMFPANQTILNFIDYLIVPALVYELGYPRTKGFSIVYFLGRLGATFITIGLLYLIVELQVTPIIRQMPNQTFVDSIADLLIPFIYLWILLFFIIFECICNACAELSCFADRQFYSDWWNSCNYQEFARLWNKPVHHFLLRHVYHESRENLNVSKDDATLITFIISSLLHELVFVMVVKRIRLYMFFMQMLQLPLIYLSKMQVFRGNDVAGNVFFWVGIFLGPPMLAVLYCRELFS